MRALVSLFPGPWTESAEGGRCPAGVPSGQPDLFDPRLLKPGNMVGGKRTTCCCVGYVYQSVKQNMLAHASPSSREEEAVVEQRLLRDQVEVARTP